LKDEHNHSDYVEIKMDSNSTLNGNEKYKRFRVTEYDHTVMKEKHNQSVHRYCFHKIALQSTVVISLPKIKTHRKAGLTCAMKNWIGLNGNKDYLPHHTKLSIAEGGDEYLYRSLRKRTISQCWEIRWRTKAKSIQKILRFIEDVLFKTQKVKPFKDPYLEGSWYGNQTLPRTICDLNRAILYADKNGNLCAEAQRKLLYLVDGIICGEGEGPMHATSKECNMILWGLNSFAIDCVVAKIMGFDAQKIYFLKLAQTIKQFPIIDFEPEDVFVSTNNDIKPVLLTNAINLPVFNFVPTSGWQGHIEH
jgi:hypothetical protein